MQERLQQLGWREIEVVDEDLARSAAVANGRLLMAQYGYHSHIEDLCEAPTLPISETGSRNT
jgi:hypothetical protein